jgi:hypothetical protein
MGLWVKLITAGQTLKIKIDVPMVVGTALWFELKPHNVRLTVHNGRKWNGGGGEEFTDVFLFLDEE